MTLSFTARYNHKIKTKEEILVVIGSRPREKKVILCHGVFDVVHPGHMRHMLYAKSKADILVVSITADRFITKGKYRPHVPQELRALNLAAFELVDFVLIDNYEKPLETINFLQPDFFAKGYEYVSKGLPPKTAEEGELISSYGGEIIFTPGDIVYSSSALIDMSPPSLKLEKLLTLMDRENISFNTLRGTLDSLKGKRIHVVGDTIVDSYTQTTMIGGQSKTPTISVLYQGRDDYIGGAAIVCMHLRATGAEVAFSTVLGNDPFKDFVLEELEKVGIETHAVISQSRPTTNKNAIVTGGYRLLKVDTVDNRSISDNVLGQMVESIQSVRSDAVVFSDFRHGIFNRRTIPKLIGAIPSGVYRVADSQVASRWGNITEFEGFDLLTPNEREARFALGDQDTGVRPLAVQLYEKACSKVLMLKLGDRGILTCRGGDHDALDSFMVLDSFADHVVDAVGAGDALLAYATLSMLVTNSPAIATILGSMAAACECECDGNFPITPNDILNKLKKVECQVNYL